MGISISLYAIREKQKTSGSDDLLCKLKIAGAPELVDLGFADTLGHLRNRKSEALIAIGQHDETHFIVDNGRMLPERYFVDFSRVYAAEVLFVDYSDSVDAGEFSFWRAGELIRKFSIGYEVWLQEFEEAGILDQFILEAVTPKDIGAPLEIEKNGSSPLDVLETYAIGYFDLYNLKWSLYKLDEAGLK